MTAADLKAARQSLGLTQRALAKALGVPVLRVIRYETGKYPVPKYIELAVQAIAQSS